MKDMTFVDHFEELRFRLLKSLFFIILFSILGYIFSDKTISLLINQVFLNELIEFQVLKITSIFLVKIGVAISTGLFISFPFILYQFLRFILPAFQNKLTSFKIILITILSIILFLLGLFFGYYIIIPFSISFFLNLSAGLDFVSLNYTLEGYLVYLIWILIISSMIFQMPLLIIILSRIGIVSYDFLSEKRRFIVVGLFIFSAILTPPDPASQIIVVIPLYILFELSLFIIKIFK
tara:strand:- start:5013 stop:5720 length:708 start_codon:yes stop_codon:yes gene_type:complete